MLELAMDAHVGRCTLWNGIPMDQERLSDVIERAQRRDPAAFEELINAYSHRLYGFLYRLCGHRDDADDLLQEVFVRLVRMIGSYEHDGRFESWLFRIAVNLARDRIRRARKSPIALAGEPDDRETEPWDGPGDTQPPDAAMELADQVDRLQWALAQLGQPEREVIMLRHFSDMSFKEIAELMGTPLGTALARAHRGLRHLRKIMEGASNDGNHGGD